MTTGGLGKFEGFLAALWSASFTVVGPEYISMVAAEAKRPRIYIKNAFKTVYWRFGLFFILGALCEFQSTLSATCVDLADDSIRRGYSDTL